MTDSPVTFTVSFLAHMLDVSPETVRRYAGRYSQWLSPYAAPEAGNERRFTEDDVRTIAWCWEQARQGQTRHEILELLPLVLPSDLPTWAQLTGGSEESVTALTPSPDPTEILALFQSIADQKNDRERIDAEVSALKSQVDSLNAQVEALRADSHPLTWWQRLTGRKPTA